MKFLIRLSVFSLIVVFFSAGVQAQPASIGIRSTGGVDQRYPIAVPMVAFGDASLAPAAQVITEVLRGDLAYSGECVILPEAEFPKGFGGLTMDVNGLNRDAWGATSAEYLIYGNVRREGTQLVAQFRLFDLFSKDQLAGQELRVKDSFPRLAAHRFTEEVLRQLTGVKGMASSEIVFSGGVTGKKEIYIADYDGANVKRLTNHGSISIKPKISPDGNRIAYLSYKDRYSFLYIFDRQTGRSMPLSKEVGLNSAPAWAPNGQYLAMTLSKDGNTEIYLKNPDGSNPRRLTNNKAGDTSPIFSPDGSRIAFVSDRGGNPNIYVMNVDGSNVQRLSYQGGSSYDPSWSPDGKMIAYVAEKRGEGLEIYVMDANGQNPRRITNTAGSNESPSWSPDSRHIAFMTTRRGRAEVWSATVKTGQQQPVPGITQRSEGANWGPRRR